MMHDDPEKFKDLVQQRWINVHLLFSTWCYVLCSLHWKTTPIQNSLHANIIIACFTDISCHVFQPTSASGGHQQAGCSGHALLGLWQRLPAGGVTRRWVL